MRVVAIKPVALGLTLAGALTLVCTRHPAEPDETASAVESELGPAGERLPEMMFVRIWAKNLVAREVIEGRRSLVEAASLFGALNRLPPESPPLALLDANGPVWHSRVRTEDERHVDPPAWPFPLGTDEDRLCRQVVVWVDRLLIDEARERADAAVARLVTEYGEELHRHGAIRLPDPASVESVEALLRRSREGWASQQRPVVPGPGETDRSTGPASGPCGQNPVGRRHHVRRRHRHARP
jgi:hypothetical protein